MTGTHFHLEGDSVRQPLAYQVSGLPDIHLVNGYEVVRHEGEEHVAVYDVDGLHKAIGRHIVRTRKVLSPAEVRFLRKTLDLTQAELASKLGVNGQSVARWEKGQCEMPGMADKLLRAVFLAGSPNQDDLLLLRSLLTRVLDELDQFDDAEPAQASFQLDRVWSETVLDAA